MGLLSTLYQNLCRINSVLLFIGRQLAWICVALMTIIILMQVYYRYIENNALPWPEEAARALMIWMTAFAAPTAYRHGGFVSIDMLQEYLPKLLRSILIITLLLIAGVILAKMVELGINFFERGFRTYTASIRFPWDQTEKLKRAWIYLAMPVCFAGMLLVNIELLLREIGLHLGKDEDFPAPPKPQALLGQGG
ncbi:MAG: TRAP transporter small permease [Thiolinea sp.]